MDLTYEKHKNSEGGEKMKKYLILGVIATFSFVLSINVTFAAPSSCATIKDGTITDAKGNPVVSGYDQYGYNYQAHMFNGYYDNYSRPAIPVTNGDKLIMKWSDAWLANVDCDYDGELDRGLVDGELTDGISKGWLTNHLVGDNYTDFVKIVWTGPGSPLWGQYTIIQEVLNDQTTGDSGLLTKIGAPGFGLNDQWTTLP